METFITWLIIIVTSIVAFLIFRRITAILAWMSEVINDTCRGKDGKWNLTNIMMIIAFDSALIIIFYDTFKNGKLNEFAVITLLVLATTGKIASAQAKKIDPTVLPPKE